MSGKLTVWTDKALADAWDWSDAVRAALRPVTMCSQPYCGRKAIAGGRCDVHRRAA